jgi:hypothetical protein
MNRTQRNLWLLAAVVFAVCMTVGALSYIVTDPWRILPDIGGDGAKNNFTYLYHCMFGKGYWFEGMNYPYGEHIVFTDGMPLLSVTFALLGNVSAGTALTACWWLLGVSYVLSILYTYKSLLHFKVMPVIAVIFAGLIGVCTPQLLCIKGHYALAFTCVVPMIFYWNIRYHESGKLKYCLWFFILGCIASFLHPYYAAMMLVWAGAYGVGYLIFTRGALKSKLKPAGALLASVIGVLLVVAVVMKVTDPVKDRPVTPYNPMEANTHIRQIFTSGFSPFWKLMTDKGVISKASDGGEGFTYPGLVVIGAVLLIFGSTLLSRFTKRKQDIGMLATGFSRIWLFVAFASLALSMGIPFIWHMKWLMNYISFFKQFRALGRFSWIFYYVITTYGVVVLYAAYKKVVATRALAGNALLVAAMCIWGLEASGYMRMSRQVSRDAAYNYDMVFSTYEQKWPSWLAEHQLSSTDFQAILMLKFYHIGSEKIWLGDGAWSNTLATRAALQLHLPIVDVMMSRSGWAQTEKQVKIAGGPFTDKPMLRDLPNRKPFLLLRYQGDSLNIDDAYLFAASTYLGYFSQCRVYACYPDSIIANDRKYASEVNEQLPLLPPGDTCIKEQGSWYVQHYEATESAHSLWGKGATTTILNDDTLLATIDLIPATDSQLYELSAWFLLSQRDPSSPHTIIELQDVEGKTLQTDVMNTNQSVDNFGLWFRASLYFHVPISCRKIKCTLVNTPNPGYLSMDELMLKPAQSLIISKGKDNSVMVNNHRFKTAK